MQWAATGEFFNEHSWHEKQQSEPMGKVIHHYLQEKWTRRALVEPGVMIVSDAIPMKSKSKKMPPHNGAFTKILGHYVREEKLLTLPEAIAKMSLLPAKRLEEFAPAFKRKGRIQAGMDADIVIFDPATVINRASYMDPYQEATGIKHIVVGGVPLVKNGKLLANTYPGKRLTTLSH